MQMNKVMPVGQPLKKIGPKQGLPEMTKKVLTDP